DYARWQRSRRLSSHRELLHVLGAKEHAVLEQGALHLLAPARTLALAKCRKNADRAKHPAHDVVDRGSCTQRSALGSGHVRQAPHHLHDFVQCQTFLVWSGEKSLVRSVDQSWKLF